ncbi:hypothetical protein, partial [Aerococcus viridans]|uniref:hypothetical protein n=1 Tax=Aerococcus viridans TaxID=1377 RepID=UPI001D0DE3CB
FIVPVKNTIFFVITKNPIPRNERKSALNFTTTANRGHFINYENTILLINDLFAVQILQIEIYQYGGGMKCIGKRWHLLSKHGC